MPRISPTHYIAPSAISIIPNANGSFNDLAVYVVRGAKIKVWSPRAGIDMANNSYQEWTLTGRNRRLAESDKPYTIYARLSKSDNSNGYLVFAAQNKVDDEWFDKYAYVTGNGLEKPKGSTTDNRYWYIRMGEVSLPENGARSIDLDTGILDTDDFNTNWALSPDALPLRVDLNCTIDDEDAGPTPYVYWGQTLILTASLVEGWTGTDIERFDHWEITRNSGDAEADAEWPSAERAEAFAESGSIALSHARGATDDFNGAFSAIFTITAMEKKENPESPENPTYVPLIAASINIHAETLEKYELVMSTAIVSYNPQSGTYNPANGVLVRVRATDQSGYPYELTNAQIARARIRAEYALADTSSWTALTFGDVPIDIAVAVIPSNVFSAQKNVVVHILSSDGMELTSSTISFVRDGEDSKEREWIFLRSITPITFVDEPGPYQKPALIADGQVNPTGESAGGDRNKNQDGWVPRGWWDEPQGVDEDHPYEYGAYRDFVRDAADDGSGSGTTGGQWGNFTDPRIWSRYAGDAVTYDIVPSVSIINADAAGHVSSDGIIVRAYRTKGTDRSDNILPPATGSNYFTEYSIDGGAWTRCAMFAYQPEGESAVQEYGIAPTYVKQAQTGIALRLKNSNNVNEVLKEISPIKVVNIVSEEETQEMIERTGDSRYLRKDQSDTTPYDLTVQGITHVKKKAIFGGNADEHEVQGHDLVAYSIYGAGYGFSFDRAGNGHVRSLVVDESLVTKELIVNRLQAQEGDTVYTDNDRIESVRPVVSEVDGSVTYVLTLEEKWEGYFTAQRYGNILKGIINTLAAAYIGALDGGSNSPVTFTAVVSPSGNPSEQGWYEQAESKYLPTTDITVTSGKTYYTVAPKQGYMEEEYNQDLNPRDVGLFERDGSTYYRSTETTMDPSKTYYREIQGTDDGGNSYFTSWMYVIGDRNTEPGILGLNQIRVALWVDHDSLPLYRNFEPVPRMVIGRCGCFDYSEPIYDDDPPAEKARKEALIKDIKKRQSYFYLSASEGRFMKLTGVSQPLLTEDNYGMVFGNTPDFIRTRSDWEELLREHPHLQDRDYLFAQGLIYSDLIQMNIAGHPVVTVVNCGDWIDGTTAGEAIATEDDSALADENDNVTFYNPGDRITTPKVTKGIYFYRSWNVATGRFETHTTRHKCGTWLCLQDQPVLIDGVKHYFEPTWNSPYWKLIDGDGTLSLGLVSSNGTTFRIGYVDTNIVPTLYFGNSPITDDVSAEYWKWERTIDTSEQRDPAAVQDDARWNAQHQHVKTLHLTSADMPLDWSFAHRAKFTCFVIVDDGKSQELVTQQMTF